MYDQWEAGLVASGNAARYKHPVHMNANGKIVRRITCLWSPSDHQLSASRECIFLDETGDNTHGKDDENRGEQRKVIPKGEIPKELVRVKDSHYTVTPITNATGTL